MKLKKDKQKDRKDTKLTMSGAERKKKRKANKKMNREADVAKKLMFFYTCMLICWTPACISVIFSGARVFEQGSQASMTLNVITSFMALHDSTTNPYLLFLLIKPLQKALIQEVHSLFGIKESKRAVTPESTTTSDDSSDGESSDGEA